MDNLIEIEAASIIEAIEGVPEAARHDYMNARINAIGAIERDEITKYMGRLSNSTNVSGSRERAKFKLTELSDELTKSMELLMGLIDSPKTTEEIKDKAQLQLDALTEFSLVVLNALATLK